MASINRRMQRLHVQLDVDYADDPKIIDAGEKAELLYLRSLAFCGRTGSDQIANSQLPRVGAGMRGVADAVAQLVEAGLWRVTTTGYVVEPLHARRISRPLIPAPIRAEVMERDEMRCVECGRTEDLTLDHIWPWSLGGEDTVDNLRVLCRPCNSRKGARV